MSVSRHALLVAPALLAACTSPPPTAAEGNQIGSMGAPAAVVAPRETVAATNSAMPAPATEASYLGRWIGVEGMVLDVKARPGGGVTIDNQWDLDNRGTFEGSVTAEGLRWMRNGEAVVASPSDGDATGLKWLAGKRDCLTVKPGEGYCRS